jgi:hypothetical protein
MVYCYTASYVLRVALKLDRDRIMAAQAERGIPIHPHIMPFLPQPLYREPFCLREGDFPAIEAADRGVDQSIESD